MKSVFWCVSLWLLFVPGSSGSGTLQAEATATLTETSETPAHRLLENRLTLREPFNKANGKIRIVAFLAPSCDRCQKNAAELQREVLAKNPTEDLAVFVVWLKVLQKDDESAVSEAKRKISDPRVQHFWDPERVLNAQLLDAVTFDVQVRFYDVFLLYDGAAQWQKRLPRPGFWMHEYKGAPGPWWDIGTFASEIEKGLEGKPFRSPLH